MSVLCVTGSGCVREGAARSRLRKLKELGGGNQKKAPGTPGGGASGGLALHGRKGGQFNHGKEPEEALTREPKVGGKCVGRGPAEKLEGLCPGTKGKELGLDTEQLQNAQAVHRLNGWTHELTGQANRLCLVEENPSA